MSNLAPEIEKTIVDTQRLVMDGLGEKHAPVRVPVWVDAIKQVANTPDELLKACLGETGKCLKRFAVRVNTDHPDLEGFPDIGDLSGGRLIANLFRSVDSIIDQARKAQEAGQEIQSEEKGLLELSSAYARLIRLLSQPRTRLLCGLQDRNDQRAIKKQVKNIGLKAALAGGENAFYSQPEHFKRFARGSKYYIEEMKGLEDRQTTFQKHGMQELAHIFAKRMRSLEESIADTCGFFRVKPDESAVVLARLHGFKWNDSGTITISSKHFKELCFWATETALEVKDDAETLKKTVILNTKFAPSGQTVMNFQYQPRMYPLAHFSAPVPELASRIIDRAEHFTLLNDSPFFDYFWVLVPSLSMNHPLLMKPKDHWTIKDGNENLVFNDPLKAAAELDARLTKEGYIVPIIIGERDGKCYFLSMWV